MIKSMDILQMAMTTLPILLFMEMFSCERQDYIKQPTMDILQMAMTTLPVLIFMEMYSYERQDYTKQPTKERSCYSLVYRI